MVADPTAKLSPAACRAGRALLDWGVRHLARAARVTPDTISQFENGRPMRRSNRAKLVAVFDAQGVELLARGGPGARLRPGKLTGADAPSLASAPNLDAD